MTKFHPTNNQLIMLLIALTLLFSGNSFALGGLGHKLVCQLSFDHLTIQTQTKINLLLLNIPKAYQQEINKFNHKDELSPVSFADSCTWADIIKKDSHFDQYKPWHYINIPRDAITITAESCNKNCITQAIILHQQQLKSSNDLWIKTQALMFLGHWLGDIHQPMHVSYPSDLGGNKNKIITSDKKCQNLHWLWDTCLLFNNLSKDNNDDELFQQLTRELSEQWQATLVTQWQQSTVFQWATESLILARSPELLYCKINDKEQCQSLSTQVITIPESYTAKHAVVLKKRILQAAARLTNILEKSLI